MKSVFLYCTFFILSNKSVGQADSSVTKIYLLSTIHTGNQLFDHKDLLKELTRLSPDIILWEQSKAYKRVFGLRTAKFLKIWNPSIEQLALQQYSKMNKQCSILPYNTTITDRRAYIKTFIQNKDQIFNLLSASQKSEADSISLANFFEQYNAYYSIIQHKTLKEINGDSINVQSRNLHFTEEKTLSQLLAKYCTDTTLINWYANERRFWVLRNEYMAKQIQKTALANPNKKIVVLNGLNHKQMLQEFFFKNPNANLRLVQLNEE